MAKEKQQQERINHQIKHIAFIMDGNGRWAQARNIARHYGHLEGFKRVREIAKACRDEHIYAMSLYAFSTENWSRPQSEIDFLFQYLNKFLKSEIKNLLQDDCRLMVSGDISRLPISSQTKIAQALEKTAHCQTYVLNICLNYGSHQEIVKAVKQISQLVIDHKVKVADINESLINQHLYTAPLPPIDLLIRTSGEVRLSNFMLYQLAYSELIFTPIRWPDFKKKALQQCLVEFASRHRRYGGLSR